MTLLGKVRSYPVLQVALDVTRLEDALRIASRLVDLGPRVVFEVGTPLLKSEGVRSIRLLRSIVGDAPLLADTKAVDVVGVEAGLVAEAGADAYTVMGFVDDEVAVQAIEAAREHGVDVVFDLMYSRNYVADAERLSRLGARVIELHVGVDVQRRLGVTAAQLTDTVRQLRQQLPSLVIAVAGGLNEKTAPNLVAAGASIIIVGSAIVKAPDPREAAERVLHAIQRVTESDS